jgi:methionyl aminopeptidase
MIIIKSPREIALMREAGRLSLTCSRWSDPWFNRGSHPIPQRCCEKVIRRWRRHPAAKGYGGFPGAICTSVNEVLVHGIPSPKSDLQDGDIVSLDIVVQLNGYNGRCLPDLSGWDLPRKQAPSHQSDGTMLLERSEQSQRGRAPRRCLSRDRNDRESQWLYAFRLEYTGHGIGREMHEDPYIPDYGEEGTGPILREGMTLAIEPMVMMGKQASGP